MDSNGDGSQSSPPLQVIQLVNQKVVIKSTDSNNGNRENQDIELTITNGVLEIIPNPIPPPPQQQQSPPSSSEDEEEYSSEEDNDGHGQDQEGLKMENLTPTPNTAASTDKGQIPTSTEPNQSSASTNIDLVLQPLHPLQIQLVTLNIGKYLTSSKGLMTARLTCKVWSNTLKPCQTVQLTNTNLQDFVQGHHSSAEVNFTSFQINRISFENQQLKPLFNQVGKFMTKLTINMDKDVELNLDQFRTIILSLSPNLAELTVNDPSETSSEDKLSTKFWNQGSLFNEQYPKQFLRRLKKLKFNIYKFQDRDESKRFLNELLIATSNLHYLSFELSSNNLGGFTDSPNTTIISGLSQKMNLERLKVLKLLHYGLSETEIDELISLSERIVDKLGLNKFSFRIGEDRFGTNEEVTLSKINKFLQLQDAASLKSLSIKISYGSNSNSLQLPTMPKLESLKLIISKSYSMSIEFDDAFHINFPGLKRLDYINTRVYQEQDELMTWFNPFTFPTPHCQLVQLRVDYIHKPVELIRLVKLFPNIVNLHVKLHSSNLINCLWNKWSKLEKLTIELKESVNDQYGLQMENGFLAEYLTGIPSEYFDTCLTQLHSSGYSLKCLNDLKKQFKVMHGLSHLKRLSYFEFKSESFDVKLSDFSIYFGLMSPNSKLNAIVIDDGRRISKFCRGLLRKKLGEQAYIHYGSKVLKR